MNSWRSTPLANCSTGNGSTNASGAGNSLVGELLVVETLESGMEAVL
jgi:hypothetical protein